MIWPKKISTGFRSILLQKPNERKETPMTNDYTHITLLVDRSNSSYENRHQIQSAINNLITDQLNQPGKVTITLTEFDNSIDTVKRMATEKFEYQLHPRYGSAIFDAVGQELAQTSADVSALAIGQRPDLVRFIVFTDGRDSRSTEYTLEYLKNAIEVLEATGSWNFEFVGASFAEWHREPRFSPQKKAVLDSVQTILERIKLIHQGGEYGDCSECFLAPHPCETLEELAKLEGLITANNLANLS